ncbi:hypothetical protein ACLOJK_006226 [Asimina triloba]
MENSSGERRPRAARLNGNSVSSSLNQASSGGNPNRRHLLRHRQQQAGVKIWQQSYNSKIITTSTGNHGNQKRSDPPKSRQVKENHGHDSNFSQVVSHLIPAVIHFRPRPIITTDQRLDPHEMGGMKID